MNPETLLQFLRNIRNLRYPITKLQNPATLEHALAEDLKVDPREAMTLLGYLLKHDYVRIIPDLGLVVNQANDEIQRLVAAGKLEGEDQP